jgi:hypothetical protein
MRMMILQDKKEHMQMLRNQMLPPTDNPLGIQHKTLFQQLSSGQLNDKKYTKLRLLLSTSLQHNVNNCAPKQRNYQRYTSRSQYRK